jgi:4'-phosphopantetheinyl transferase EntD
MKTPWPERALILRDSGAPLDRWFTEDELAAANAFKLPSRRDEWLLSRVAAKQLAMQRGLAHDPRAITIERPFLLIDGARSEWHVSLSHSGTYAAAAIAREPIGIDIEVVRNLDERATHLFLTGDETRELQGCRLAHRVLHFWSAKEAAWKQRSEEFVTLRQAPLRLLGELADGLLFDAVETSAVDDVIAAITRPIS